MTWAEASALMACLLAIAGWTGIAWLFIFVGGKPTLGEDEELKKIREIGGNKKRR